MAFIAHACKTTHRNCAVMPDRTGRSRGNTRVAYDPGSQSDPNAPAVVMLHALLADRSVFAAQRDVLSSRYRVILPDARGHGASATLANQWYTVAELAQDVLAIFDAEGIA